jgi:hypothetical protein
MKRCPQCEFIYEDDQTCCDMDGLDLIFDENTLPGIVALQTRSVAVPVRPRRSILFSFLGVLVGVVLLAIGYASFDRAVTLNQEQALQPDAASANQPPSKAQVLPAKPLNQTPITETAGEDLEAAVVAARASKVTQTSNSERSRTSVAKPVLIPPVINRNVSEPRTSPTTTPRSEAPLPVRPSAKPQTAPAQKDSKIVSAIKKTGRFITKPFKL